MRNASNRSSVTRSAGSAWRTHLYIAAIALAALGSGAIAQPPDRELLNSERIAAAFGSYGIEVLEQDDGGARLEPVQRRGRREDLPDVRGRALCSRTSIPAVSAEHAAIVAGGSIGAVFAAAGWEVRKTHLSYSETPRRRRGWPR